MSARTASRSSTLAAGAGKLVEYTVRPRRPHPLGMVSSRHRDSLGGALHWLARPLLASWLPAAWLPAVLLAALQPACAPELPAMADSPCAGALAPEPLAVVGPAD